MFCIKAGGKVVSNNGSTFPAALTRALIVLIEGVFMSIYRDLERNMDNGNPGYRMPASRRKLLAGLGIEKPDLPELGYERVLDRCEIGDCWVWKGSHQGSYGQIKVLGKVRLVHHVVWEGLVGPIPSHLTLRHHCLVDDCVNTDHEYLGKRGRGKAKKERRAAGVS